jgi:membrane-associated protease RseP (regulator of RpoE activity)
VTDTPQLDPPSPSPAPARPPLGQPRGEVAGGGWRLVLLAAAVILLGVLGGKGWLFITLGLTVMIFLHELGHFVTAKLSGMKVTEFFLGFGPKLWSFRRGETEYGVKLIPVLAYVRIVGMNNLDEVPPEDEPRTFRQQSFPKRALVMSAGSLMHFIQAFVILIVVFAMVGVPGDTDLATQLGGRQPSFDVESVLKGSSAATAGMKAGDQIVAIDGHEVSSMADVSHLIAPHPDEKVVVTVSRHGEELDLPAVIGRVPDQPGRGRLGINMEFIHLDQLPKVTAGPVTAVGEAGKTVVDWMGEHVKFLGSFATGGLGNFARDVADGGSKRGDSPAIVSNGNSNGKDVQPAQDDTRFLSIYGVARLGAQASQNGAADFLMLLALVNVAIGVINLVPLLPFDGGHLSIAIYERFRSRRGRRHMADVSRLLPLTYAVVLVLSVLMVSTVYLDIVDPIRIR